MKSRNGIERWAYIVQLLTSRQPDVGRIFLNEAKPFQISKKQVSEALKGGKVNGGAADVDGKSIAV